MDSGRLPPYRSAYLLRFHPYPRVKPSTGERVAQTWNHEFDGPRNHTPQLENDFTLILHQADVSEVPLRHHSADISSVILDLALLFARKLCLRD